MMMHVIAAAHTAASQRAAATKLPNSLRVNPRACKVCSSQEPSPNLLLHLLRSRHQHSGSDTYVHQNDAHSTAPIVHDATAAGWTQQYYQRIPYRTRR
jgi:hypothetical protein